MIFYKTVSAGNDFIHVEIKGKLVKDNHFKSSFARQICDRKSGVGADGIVFYHILKHGVFFRIFNQNGQEAELSGNGMAGLSAILFDLNFFKKRVVLETRVGKREVLLLNRAKKEFLLNVEIGNPDFHNLEFFPFIIQKQIEYKFKKVSFYPVSVGNPHAVVLLGKEHPLKQLQVIGKSLSTAPIFPLGTNVELVAQKDDKFMVFFYERGVGETGSSSTGSAAVFSVLQRLKKIQNTLEIENPFRPIKISGDETVRVENFSEIVYKGIYNP
jgi:diaminopimelate epimerase